MIPRLPSLKVEWFSAYHKAVADLRGGYEGRAPPGAQILSISWNFLAKFGKIVCWRPPGELAPPPRGNPGSATARREGTITIHLLISTCFTICLWTICFSLFDWLLSSIWVWLISESLLSECCTCSWFLLLLPQFMKGNVTSNYRRILFPNYRMSFLCQSVYEQNCE